MEAVRQPAGADGPAAAGGSDSNTHGPTAASWVDAPCGAHDCQHGPAATAALSDAAGDDDTDIVMVHAPAPASDEAVAPTMNMRAPTEVETSVGASELSLSRCNTT